MSARFNLELAPEAKGVVNHLMKETGLRTQAAVFENALALLSWAVREASRGRIIASLDEATKQYAELHMPALMGVKYLPPSGQAEPAPSPRPNSQGGEQRSRKKELAVTD